MLKDHSLTLANIPHDFIIFIILRLTLIIKNSDKVKQIEIFGENACKLRFKAPKAISMKTVVN